MSLRITQANEVGKVIATYVESPTTAKGDARIDVIPSEQPKGLWKQLLEVFLPTGYPHSVTEDYLECDSLQAFASSIAGLLASRAVLEGVGVGDASASPTAAILLTILQESMGRIATILFAYRLGTVLEPECKMFRLLADVFNDFALILDSLSPVFPRTLRVLVLSCSSVLRALCGVAAGSSKASLSAHFAHFNNMAELNAKDSSQETVISLLGMAAGSVVVSTVTTPFATWLTLSLLLSAHLWLNHKAVRAVVMKSLNRQRATIVLSHYFAFGIVLSPVEVSKKERIFANGSIVRDFNNSMVGRCKICTTPMELLSKLGQFSANGQSVTVRKKELLTLLKQCQNEKYIMHTIETEEIVAYILLKVGCTSRDQLQAWYCALLDLHCRARPEAFKKWESLLSARALLSEKLLHAGWDLDSTTLQTQPSCRISVATQ
ncbi:hypothetical protein AAFC00_003740 [Neodothiora populina]|uniref:Protein root UVB sensitive/RUS domain-containing protein n=1 Tax=Neodothiora populina TaxID=2781224 RepID=A0ABR3PF87_9PEZI